MRCSRKAFQVTVAACGFGLLSGWAQADVFLTGTLAGRPGDTVDVSLWVAADTLLDFVDISPDYGSFANILTLVAFQPSPALSDGSGPPVCGDDGMCAVFFSSTALIARETVLATWRFKVTQNAEDFVDPDGANVFPLDLGVTVGSILLGPQGLPPENQVFRVLAVPEPSSWSVVAVGVLLLVATRLRRRSHGSRGPVRGDSGHSSAAARAGSLHGSHA